MKQLIGSKAGALATLLATTLLATACSREAAAPTAADAGNGLTIGFKTVDEPAEGRNRLEAVVAQNGKPVTDATVEVTFRMPAMPAMQMPEMHSTTALTHESAGRYVGTGELEMTGTWNVTVAVSRGGAELGSSRFTLIAK